MTPDRTQTLLSLLSPSHAPELRAPQAPLLERALGDFLRQPGKQFRPLLFLIGFSGHTTHQPAGLTETALSLELLHSFALIHDDIVDHARIRRNKPTLPIIIEKLTRSPHTTAPRCQNLAMIAGDFVFAAAVRTFLAIRVHPLRKERALVRLLSAACDTAVGEFNELLLAQKSIRDVREEEIRDVYDRKTAHYSFAAPLAIGATLAGAPEPAADMLAQYGMHVGRAYQLKDDLAGVLGSTRILGKSTTSDLAQSKKTLLAWHTYHHLPATQARHFAHVLQKPNKSARELSELRTIMRTSGVAQYAKEKIQEWLRMADELDALSSLKPVYQRKLTAHISQLVSL